MEIVGKKFHFRANQLAGGKKSEMISCLHNTLEDLAINKGGPEGGDSYSKVKHFK